MRVEYPKANNIQSSVRLGTWGETQIPVYDVFNMHALNQLVGYVKLINAEHGTVLYRGQCKLYAHLTPSIVRDNASLIKKREELKETLAKIRKDEKLNSYFNFDNCSTCGWEVYENNIIEAALQHYGAATFCVDFVDNHWTALWFGLYEFDKQTLRYKKRVCSENDDDGSGCIAFIQNRAFPEAPQFNDIILTQAERDFYESIAQKGKKELDVLLLKARSKKYNIELYKWNRLCEKTQRINNMINRGKQNHMFLFLYVAETNAPTFRGSYFGENTYVLDLRKALPSTFLRPSSQHGWIVKGKEENYCFDDNIVCIVRLNIEMVDNLLGNGLLLTETNFFPTYKLDHGYKTLLGRQLGTKVASTRERIMPASMIMEIKE